MTGFVPEFFAGLLLALLKPFSALEKAASSILLLVLEGLLDPGEDPFALLEFNLEEDA